MLEEAFMTAADPHTPSGGANYEHDPLSEAVIKCVFTVANMAQCLNYLKATGIHTSLLINFGIPKPQIRRLSR